MTQHAIAIRLADPGDAQAMALMSRDLIESGLVPTVRLQQIFRQARQSRIVVNAHRVNRGEFPLVESEQGRRLTSALSTRATPEESLAVVEELCAERLPRLYHVDPLTDIQVIRPIADG